MKLYCSEQGVVWGYIWGSWSFLESGKRAKEKGLPGVARTTPNGNYWGSVAVGGSEWF